MLLIFSPLLLIPYDIRQMLRDKIFWGFTLTDKVAPYFNNLFSAERVYVLSSIEIAQFMESHGVINIIFWSYYIFPLFIVVLFIGLGVLFSCLPVHVIYKFKYFSSSIVDCFKIFFSSQTTVWSVLLFWLTLNIMFVLPEEITITIFAVICICAVLLVLFTLALELLNNWFKYKKIIENKLNDRGVIYNGFSSLDSSRFYQKKFVRHLADNLALVKGEWPSEDIFELPLDENATQLAILDMKWRGLDR